MRALSFRLAIVTPRRDTDYGSRDFAARGPGGNLWSFGGDRPAAGGSGAA